MIATKILLTLAVLTVLVISVASGNRFGPDAHGWAVIAGASILLTVLAAIIAIWMDIP